MIRPRLTSLRIRVAYEKNLRWIHAYTRLGWPVCTAAYLRAGTCTCGSESCTAPGRHRTSVPTTDIAELTALLREDPETNLMVGTGKVVDAVEVPAPLGRLAVARLAVEAPVASSGESYVFFASGDTPPVGRGLQWYGTGGHVLVPPSTVPPGRELRWIHAPEHPLPQAEALACTLGTP